VSEVIDEEAVAGYVLEIANILQMFIHQQYSGRILCFLLLLGYLCESLSKECEKFTDELDKIMGMDVSKIPSQSFIQKLTCCSLWFCLKG
jgi:hypothetical protein